MRSQPSRPRALSLLCLSRREDALQGGERSGQLSLYLVCLWYLTLLSGAVPTALRALYPHPATPTSNRQRGSPQPPPTCPTTCFFLWQMKELLLAGAFLPGLAALAPVPCWFDQWKRYSSKEPAHPPHPPPPPLAITNRNPV